MRVLAEALYVAVGIGVTLLLAALAAWAYPLAHDDIWTVTGVGILCIVALGIGPMRRAAAADRFAKGGGAVGGVGDA